MGEVPLAEDDPSRRVDLRRAVDVSGEVKGESLQVSSVRSRSEVVVELLVGRRVRRW